MTFASVLGVLKSKGGLTADPISDEIGQGIYETGVGDQLGCPENNGNVLKFVGQYEARSLLFWGTSGKLYARMSPYPYPQTWTAWKEL